MTNLLPADLDAAPAPSAIDLEMAPQRQIRRSFAQNCLLAAYLACAFVLTFALGVAGLGFFVTGGF